MAPASNEEQFKFLISCIRYSNNGKVDFDAVANECDICSKGAAAKRYERMMKAHGIHQSQNQTAIRDTPVPSRRKTSPVAGSSKKRKHDQFTETNVNTDDDEGLSHVKAEGSETKVKTEQIKAEASDTEVKTAQVKKEPMIEEGTPEWPMLGAPCTSSLQTDGTDDASMFNDFLAFGAYGQQDAGSQVDFDGGYDQDGSTGLRGAPTSSDGLGIQESIVIAD